MNELGLDKASLDLLRQEAEKSLYFFAKAILGYSWLSKSVHQELCQVLEDDAKPDKLIVLPRGWFKTTICSIAWPIWLSVKNPNIRILLVQNTFTNALAKNATIKAHWEKNVLLKTLWPDLVPNKGNTWRGESLCLNRSEMYPESTYECAGVGTQITSRHYDVIIEDDTVAPDPDELKKDNLIPSKGDIEQAIGYHKLITPILVSRAEGEVQSKSLVVGTRWFEVDLISHVMENEPHYFKYMRAARETDRVPDPDGDPAFPERFGEFILRRIESRLGPYLFSCLYMNKPVPGKEMSFDPSWFKFYEMEDRKLDIFVTVDPAGDPEEQQGDPDYNVVMCAGYSRRSGRVFVLDYFREKCSPLDLINAIFDMVKKWGAQKVGIESVAYQSTLVYWVKKQMVEQEYFFPVEPITHGRRNKASRILGLQPLVASGKLVFRTWMKALIQELQVFPLGANDDLADALSMQLGFWSVAKETAKTEEPDPLEDEFSLESALESIRRMNSTESEGAVFDVFDTSFTLN